MLIVDVRITSTNGLKLIESFGIQNISGLTEEICNYKVKRLSDGEEVVVRHNREAGYLPLVVNALNQFGPNNKENT